MRRRNRPRVRRCTAGEQCGCHDVRTFGHLCGLSGRQTSDAAYWGQPMGGPSWQLWALKEARQQ